MLKKLWWKTSMGGGTAEIPYVDEVLRELKQHYRLGIITNTVASHEQHAKMALRRIGLKQYFDVILTSVDASYKKPDKESTFI